MEFIGKWIVKKTMHFGEDGLLRFAAGMMLLERTE